MKSLIGRLLRRFRIRGTLPALIRSVNADRITYLEPAALSDLYAEACRLERKNVTGLFVECGTALGGSAIVIASAKSKTRPLNIYDVFGMIPPPSELDGTDVRKRYEVIRSGQAVGINGEKYYGYCDNLLEIVQSNFQKYGFPAQEHNIRFVQGLFQDTLTLNEPVALAHIDSDWYESVMTCLQRIAPVLVPGGVLVIDDYDTWSGCKSAVDQYFANRKEYSFMQKSRLHIRRR